MYEFTFYTVGIITASTTVNKFVITINHGCVHQRKEVKESHFCFEGRITMYPKCVEVKNCYIIGKKLRIFCYPSLFFIYLDDSMRLKENEACQASVRKIIMKI